MPPVDDFGIEVLKKVAEEVIIGDKSNYIFKSRNEIVSDVINQNVWSVSVKENVVNGATLSLTITSPAEPIKISFSSITFNSQSSFNQDFIEGTTIATPGTLVTIHNVERNSTKVTSTVARKDDIITGGTLLVETPIGAGSKNNPTGASITSDTGWVLKPATDYTFILTNTSGAAQNIGIILRYVEK